MSMGAAMVHPAVVELVKRIPPPHRPDPFEGTTLNLAVGGPLQLPADYIEFMQLYGPGWFTENGIPSVQILDLSGETDLEGVRWLLKNAADGHSYSQGRLPAPYPASPGVLPWGTWDQGFTLYWLVAGHANEWTIAVDARSEVEWYSCSFTEYLLGTVARRPGREFRTYLVPDDVSEARYCPSSRYRECFTGEYKP